MAALKPALVWKHFAEIVRIPRPSHHEEKIRKYILDFARAQGLACKEDSAHNVYVSKPASKGMENRKGVILQAHLDMVPQKNNDKQFDFTKDPIDAYVDGDWVTADGTTLGADNGIGAAAILAVLEDKTLKHGPLEALFTATEETGMDGAAALDCSDLKGRLLLNLDSEEEGVFTVACAGGLRADCFLPAARQALGGERSALATAGRTAQLRRASVLRSKSLAEGRFICPGHFNTGGWGCRRRRRNPDTLLKRHNKRHDYQCIPQYLTCI